MITGSSAGRPDDPQGQEGFVAALDGCHEQAVPGGIFLGHRGIALGSRQRVRSTSRFDDGRRVYRLTEVTVREFPPQPGEAPGVARIAVTPRQPGCGAPTVLSDARCFPLGLLHAHLRTLLRLLDHTVAHLGGRTSAGSSLLSKQLVQGIVADTAIELGETATVLDGTQPESVHAWAVHQRLVSTGRRLLRLLGASGFLSDGPGAELYLAELAGNVYLHPEMGVCDA